MSRSFKYTDDQLDYLREGYKKWRIKELTQRFNMEFDLSKEETTIKSLLTRFGFKCGRKPGLPKGEAPSVWTPAQLDFLREHYPKMSQPELIKAFNQRFETERTQAQLHSTLKRYKIKSGRTGRFEKGTEPPYKGKKAPWGANATSFKKGQTPWNHKPIGHEYTSDGYILVKTAEPNTFEFKHLLVWRKHHGEVPKKHVIRFKDGNRANCSIANLEAISKAEHCLLNKQRYEGLDEELKPVIKTLTKLRIRLAEVNRA